MESCISFYGGMTPGRMTLAYGHGETVDVNRDVWFDQDFNGHWLVGAAAHDGTMADSRDSDRTGAILVKSPEVTAFLTLLGKLIAVPGAFEHEPVFTGVETVPDPPRPVVPGQE